MTAVPPIPAFLASLAFAASPPSQEWWGPRDSRQFGEWWSSLRGCGRWLCRRCRTYWPSQRFGCSQRSRPVQPRRPHASGTRGLTPSHLITTDLPSCIATFPRLEPTGSYLACSIHVGPRCTIELAGSNHDRHETGGSATASRGSRAPGHRRAGAVIASLGILGVVELLDLDRRRVCASTLVYPLPRPSTNSGPNLDLVLYRGSRDVELQPRSEQCRV